MTRTISNDIAHRGKSVTSITDGNDKTFETLEGFNDGMENALIFEFPNPVPIESFYINAEPGNWYVDLRAAAGGTIGYSNISMGETKVSNSTKISSIVVYTVTRYPVKIYEFGVYEHRPKDLQIYASNVEMDSIGITASASHADKLEIYRNGTKVETIKSFRGTFVDTGLSPDTTYRYHLRAINNAGYVEGTPISVKTLPPPKPTSLFFETLDIKADSVRLKGTAEFAKKIKLYRDGELVYTFNHGFFDYIDRDLEPGTSYSYHFIATNDAGDSASPIKTIQTLPPPPPPKEVLLELVDSGGRWATLKMKADGATQFQVFRDGGLIRTFPAGVNWLPFTDSTLEFEKTYEYYVIARNKWGEITSDTVIVTTEPKPPPGPPPPPMPDPPATDKLPRTDVDTGNKDLDAGVTDLLDGMDSIKIGGMAVVFWAMFIALLLFALLWLWKLFKQRMALHAGVSMGGVSGGPGGGGGRSSVPIESDSSGSSKSSSEGGEAYETMTYQGREYQVPKGSYDGRVKAEKYLPHFK